MSQINVNPISNVKKGSRIPADYIEKVYAGWLGKVIGVRHGGNVEGWSYERLERTYGEITGYLHEFKNFAADDDTNGPMFFLRALEDFTHTSEITAEQMGLTLLNYAPDGHGFFWWGGYGKSTEHTAYLNLKNGITAPRSGSIEQNGHAVAEQIGGQIFIDVWGLVAPGNPQLAAEYASKMASVTHDGNGKYGGEFIAACIAQAFVEKDIEKIIEAGLSVIPADSEYTRMTRDVIRFYKENPSNWRDCFKFVQANYGYDRYPGVCHIIPNSAVIVLSLLYGEGDFSQSINICNMCGWDTDCNVANVGTIIGVRNGIEGIDPSWRKPINDFLCCSSVIGSLNIVDIPWCATYISKLGYLIAGEEPPGEWKAILEGKSPRFHFEYPGSTHAFRLEHQSKLNVHITGTLQNSEEYSEIGTRSLKVVFDNVQGGDAYRVYHKTYYKPEDFNDSRYDPSFSPIVYPGQSLEAKVLVPDDLGIRAKARLYVKDGNKGSYFYGEEKIVEPGKFCSLKYAIPALQDVHIEEAGIEFVPVVDRYYTGSLIAYIDSFDFSGSPDYEINFKNERMEHWTPLHLEVSQFTYLRGIWSLEDGELSGSYFGEPAECYTGEREWRDYQFSAEVKPKLGAHHNIQFRVQGGIRSYAVGLAPNHEVVLYKNENGYRSLVSTSYLWDDQQSYRLMVEAKDNHFIVSVNGDKVIEYTDIDNPYLFGQVGFSNFNGSHTHYAGFSVKGL
ncbi:ADP-ribosylglycohydrolase family protein [Neobacillus sp. SuZ13]|uniref:ADP-ribosylglycohydrolase family protein n=1 Tax=Neobacillus sp. SuZ13 TaxID=3047875 RepID=UPI0024BFB21B|nr:ADP-ribosylglycohydrolase family protein [Neobacillus sp. SuZ13]WHY66479.1 ADP-ribosylglycohydrolase family protein [Neobacillus sp. SuZ13]